jgi:hypothetical protein
MPERTLNINQVGRLFLCMVLHGDDGPGQIVQLD